MAMRRLQGHWGKLSSVCLVMAMGCGSPELAPVRGTITLEDKPIGPGNVLFIPTGGEAQRGKAASGTFEVDGQYELTTYEDGDGALVGEHKVVIMPRGIGAEPGGEYPTNTKLPPIPRKYGDFTSSPLSATVQGGSNTIDFQLVRNP